LRNGGLIFRMWSIIRRHGSFLRQFILYGIIGCLAAIIDSFLFYVLSKSLNVNISNFISVNCGIVLSFFMNTFVNFKIKNKMVKRVLLFFFIAYCGLGLSMIILWVGVNRMDIEKMYVKIASVIIVAIIQFTLNKRITYRYD
jgi:putative flippase GtrA